ncbi:hypothetical protein ACFO9Q_09940 [Paenibacillus sp. GCM10023252]|uniref:hypothetical protein n=1 Tax=Paenibacillus sp. GCM10023252 TaxID=3252649 RepID=UPI00361F0536
MNIKIAITGCILGAMLFAGASAHGTVKLEPAAGLAAAEQAAAPAAAQPAEQPGVESRSSEGEYGHNRAEHSREQWEAHRLERLRYMAKYFGIETEGKSPEQLRQEVHAAKLANKEKWEALKAEHKAKRLEYLRKYAESRGIASDGKTEKELRAELHKQFMQRSQEPNDKK